MSSPAGQLLAVFHILMGPLSGSGISPGQMGPQAVLPNLDGTLSGLYIKAGPQAWLYGWVDQGGCSQLGEVVGWIFWSGGDASTPQLGGDDEYALGLRRISILASWSGKDTSYALQLGRVRVPASGRLLEVHQSLRITCPAPLIGRVVG